MIFLFVFLLFTYRKHKRLCSNNAYFNEHTGTIDFGVRIFIEFIQNSFTISKEKLLFKTA